MRPSSANHWNAPVIEEYYAKWLEEPTAVDEKWQAFFQGFALGSAGQPPAEADGAAPQNAAADWQERVDELIRAYRTLGHTLARIDPLETEAPEQPLLTLEALGFSEADLDQPASSRYFLGGKAMSLRDMISALQRIYCGKIGTEFMHISSTKVRNWVRDRLETWLDTTSPEREAQHRILRHLLAAESFERFLHTRYVGQKRFSLEGGESLMPLLETVLERCPSNGIEELVMGMAHRGRLNVLANYLKKTFQMIFTEFSENFQPNLTNGDGDVKYHLGYESDREVSGGKGTVRVQLASNPSHLEAVDPVVQGRARARQRILDDIEARKKVMPVLIHGDAAFIGQGIVAETLNLSQLPGYRTGGTLHVIVNNQIGFTTLPADSRSSLYCTDIAKMIDAPVFHVNGDDPEAVCFVAAIAVEFRQQFGRDVIIDMYCYRRYGHNEGDEPTFTQPDLYAQIATHPSVATLYTRKLLRTGRLTEEESAAMVKELDTAYETALQEVKAQANGEQSQQARSKKSFAGSTAIFQPPYSFEPVDTAITPECLEHIARDITRAPEGIKILPKLKRNLLDRRLQVFEAGGPYDWAFGEALAFGSLLLDGKPVRLSGQDSRRGTFSHRLSVLYDVETRERYIPLNNLAKEQARFCVYNSPLSENAVLGFDYGYSLDYPQMLCIWEAQFGDFVNGAQVVIDQFIVAAESKWQRPSGIVLLLPHGYEGQGPEHSSGRVERFLQSCAEENIQVCNLTTPAQYFHVLRRQMMRPFRKPLIIMTPKSLLRSELAVSFNKDFTEARFEEILETPPTGGREKAERVILCTGKVYYDLLKERDARKADNAALVRVEQLYPLHADKLRAILAPYTAAKDWVWCQEESQNMGAWTFISPLLEEILGGKVRYAGRNASASPAVGAKTLHDREQRELVNDAFGG